ncbi:MAG: hypothetical protein LBI48_12870 [Burkholderiaceae bacterium]|nr:hypothetical protein [Burkholderiaceae bacterium]
MKSFLLALLLGLAAVSYAAEPDSGLPKEKDKCGFEAKKKVLAHFKGRKKVNHLGRKSRFMTPGLILRDFTRIDASDDSRSTVKAPDGSFSLIVTPFREPCGDTQKYTVIFQDSSGKSRPLTAGGCEGAESLAGISPDSKYILLSGLRYVDVKKWEICPLLGKPDYGYQNILGWSRDGNKILIRDYNSLENADEAFEYLIKIKRLP